MKQAGVDAEEVVGLGVDFTSCTVLPVTSDGVPLCTIDEWRERRHAWPKLWKHHAAQPVADRLNEVALERGDAFLERYGGRISSEWYFPKLIEVWLEDREIYDECADFIEATDWIIWHLTGVECRQTATAGFKAMWSPEEGLPPTEYFDHRLSRVRPPGREARRLVRAARDEGRHAPARGGEDASGCPSRWRSRSGTSTPGCRYRAVGVDEPGTFVIVIGTSICDMIVHPEETRLPGITGVVKDGILPGLYGYEAGQAAVGDMLAWFVDDVVMDSDSYGELEKAAAKLAPGETGLVALDWWNGNRTILADADLTGVIFGLGLHTTREQIYRALLESIAFGSRRIMDNFEEHGLVLSQVVACGGIAERSPLMMQLLADTSGREVHVPEVKRDPRPRRRAVRRGGGRRVRGHRERRRGHASQEGAYVQAGPNGEEDLRPRVRDLPQAVRVPRPRRGTPAARPETDSHRKERRVSRQPRIGLLGIMQELYDDMIPGITERQGQYAAAVAERLAGVADVQFTRPARNREDVERISRELVAADVDGIAIVMLTYGPAMRTVRALMQTPVPLMLANIQPERSVTAGVGHGRPDLQPGHPRRPGPGQRAASAPACRSR